MTKSATTSVDIIPVLRERWSPWAFATNHELSDLELSALLEAARWTPSSNNSQPWRFIVGRRNDATFSKIFTTLKTGNQAWAGSASALIVAVGAQEDEGGNALSHSDYDVGAAVAQMVVQAHGQNLFAHQIGGFDSEALQDTFEIPDVFVPRAVIAVGVLGEDDLLSEKLRRRATTPRTRLALKDLAFKEKWGKSAV